MPFDHELVTEHVHAALDAAIGTPFEGGFYAGRFALDGAEYALILAPKASGSHDRTPWGKYGQDIEGARSFNDGRANTEAMAAAGSALAQWALELEIEGYADWYIPSRDELELLYRHFKPTAETNYTWRSGDNPSSLPAGYPYTEESPAQTSLAAFQEGGELAFEDASYWASTQSSPGYAWIQTFVDGNQYVGHKDYERRAVAVRRFKVSP